MLQGYRQSARGDSCLLRRQICAAPKIRWAKHQVECLVTVSAGKVAVGLLPTSICRSRTKSGWRSRTDLHFTALPFSRRQSPSLYFQQQQKELLARRAPEGCNPSLRKKRGAGLFKRTCSLVFITSTFGFFLALRHQTVPQTGSYTSRWAEKQKICCVAKRRDVRTIVASFSTVRKNLKSWQVKDKRGAAGKCGYSSVEHILLQIKAEYFYYHDFNLLSRTPICFVLTNIYLSDWDQSDGKRLYWFILFGDGRWLKLTSIICAHENPSHQRVLNRSWLTQNNWSFDKLGPNKGNIWYWNAGKYRDQIPVSVQVQGLSTRHIVRKLGLDSNENICGKKWFTKKYSVSYQWVLLSKLNSFCIKVVSVHPH